MTIRAIMICLFLIPLTGYAGFDEDLRDKDKHGNVCFNILMRGGAPMVIAGLKVTAVTTAELDQCKDLAAYYRQLPGKSVNEEVKLNRNCKKMLKYNRRLQQNKQ